MFIAIHHCTQSFHMGVSLNGGTPISQPKMIIFSRKTPIFSRGIPPFLVGKSPLLVGKPPFLVGKPLFLVGKPPISKRVTFQPRKCSYEAIHDTGSGTSAHLFSGNGDSWWSLAFIYILVYDTSWYNS